MAFLTIKLVHCSSALKGHMLDAPAQARNILVLLSRAYRPAKRGEGMQLRICL